MLNKEKDIRTTLVLPQELHKELRHKAIELNMSLSKYVISLLHIAMKK